MIEALGVEYLIEGRNYFYNREDKIMVEIGDNLKSSIFDNKALLAKIKEDVYNFSDLVLKDKIYHLDLSTNKQLTFNRESIFTEDITIKQTQKIYEKTINYLSRSMVDIYAEYYYRGLIREVFERYQ